MHRFIALLSLMIGTTLLSAQQAPCPVALKAARWEHGRPDTFDNGKKRTVLHPYSSASIKYKNLSTQDIRSIQVAFTGSRLTTSVTGAHEPKSFTFNLPLEGLSAKETVTNTADISPALPISGNLHVVAIYFTSGQEWHAPDSSCSVALKGAAKTFAHIHIGLPFHTLP